jgi:eukaryotic-like serine/threonine-protein kinase
MKRPNPTPPTFQAALPPRIPMDSRVRVRNVLPEWEIDNHASEAWEPPRHLAPLRPGTIVGTKFELVRQIGKGGMGSVWEALQTEAPNSCRVVALKILSDEAMGDASAIARFEREAVVASKLSGPHFPQIHDWGFHRGMAFMAMELFEGEDLFTRLERLQVLTVWETLATLRPLGRALDAVHRAGVVHRDVKPRNIFFAKEGAAHRVVLLDFGVAKPNTDAIRITRTGILVGSPHYMSPEQVTSTLVDARSDLWSLAAVAFRCLTGQRPFDGRFEKALRDILTGAAPRASTFVDVPSGLDDFFARAFQKAPADRFQSAAELVHAFESALLADDRLSRFSVTDESSEELTLSDIAWARRR